MSRTLPPTPGEAEQDLRAAAFGAYHRGASDAAERIGVALARHPLDGGLLIADATLALEAALPQALDRLAATLRQAPDWLDGHVALAQLRWGAGERDGFLGSIESALCDLPRHAGLWMRYMALLADSGQALRAADVAAELRRTGGDVAALRLLEARYAGAAGALHRAAALIESLPVDMPDRAQEAARHQLRIGDPEACERWLEIARAHAPDDAGIWALTELAWRATTDPRHPWLIDLDTMVTARPIDIPADELAVLASDLRSIHRARWPALGQSVRNGTQTRGDLSQRGEVSLQRLFARIEAAVADRVAALPPIDDSHPLLRHRATDLSVRSAWSIRIDGVGYHVSHVHPGGILSSAFHVAVPKPRGAAAQGTLELGRPPADIALPLEPIAAFEPVVGNLVLFPSYLYHGTVPFDEGERMSVAFDLA